MRHYGGICFHRAAEFHHHHKPNPTQNGRHQRIKTSPFRWRYKVRNQPGTGSRYDCRNGRLRLGGPRVHTIKERHYTARKYNVECNHQQDPWLRLHIRHQPCQHRRRDRHQSRYRQHLRVINRGLAVALEQVTSGNDAHHQHCPVRC
ncbi:MAG: YjbF family lipoprotein [Acidobacteria bacterium]|nr:YjbF family lipoprotein [Acidobacteriota bacterium]